MPIGVGGGVVLVVVVLIVVVGVDTVGLPTLVRVGASGVAVTCGVAFGTEAGGTEARVVGDENGNDEGDDEDEGDEEKGDEEKGDETTLRAAGTAAAERAVRRALLARALSLCARVAADDEWAARYLRRAQPQELRSESLVCLRACMGGLAATAADATRLAAKAPASPQCSDRGTRCG